MKKQPSKPELTAQRGGKSSDVVEEFDKALNNVRDTAEFSITTLVFFDFAKKLRDELIATRQELETLAFGMNAALSNKEDELIATRQELAELSSAVLTVNKSGYHELRITGDDEICYWQRKEWVDWVVELASKTQGD